MTRDALMVDAELVEPATAEARRLARALRLDATDAKEIYRSVIEVAIRAVLSKRAATIEECAAVADRFGNDVSGWCPKIASAIRQLQPESEK